MERLPVGEAPQTIWPALDAALDERRSSRAAANSRLKWSLAAAAALLLASVAYWQLAQPSGRRWEVKRLEGSPSVDAKTIHGSGQIGAGEWIETDGKSRATINVGEIGFVEIAPNTKLRILVTRPDEHRLALARGTIRAAISAPPKLFFVETASGTAVDLGCEYELKTTDDGTGWLRVTRGWVSFEWKGIESLVPAGASCRTQPQVGPGIPYFDDARESLKQALAVFGSEKAGDDVLGIILSASRVRDTLTLWHLLSRVEGRDRERVFDRIAALTPVPAGVSRDRALQLDPETLKRWKDELAWKW